MRTSFASLRPLTSVTDEYDAVVYDLDGTLVRLQVDWAVARDDALAAVREADIAVDDIGLWALLDRAHREGFAEVVERVVAGHERRGARTAERLPTADDLPRSVPVGVCSLNSEAACRLALERHGLDGYVDSVVGRDSVDTYKPDPEPLLTVVDALSVTPGSTLFVGDSERDEQTAEQAGVAFRYVAEPT